MPAVLGSLTNEARVQNNLDNLQTNPLLEIAAENKALDMANKSYFAHESPDGRMPWDWIEEAGYDYSYAGENLAVNFIDSEEVINAWMRSPSHRKNILNVSFKEIGLGMVKGFYKSREAIFIVQMFGASAKLSPQNQIVAAPLETPPVTVNNAKKPTSTVFSQSTGTVSGASVEKKNYSAKITDKLLVSPKTTVNWFFYFMLGTALLALILNILIEIKIQHPDLIANGVFLVCMITSAIVVNHYLSILKGTITAS